ncbi:hypothetical protein ACLOJK_039022 [Asimina triloba]
MGLQRRRCSGVLRPPSSLSMTVERPILSDQPLCLTVPIKKLPEPQDDGCSAAGDRPLGFRRRRLLLLIQRQWRRRLLLLDKRMLLPVRGGFPHYQISNLRRPLPIEKIQMGFFHHRLLQRLRCRRAELLPFDWRNAEVADAAAADRCRRKRWMLLLPEASDGCHQICHCRSVLLSL